MAIFREVYRIFGMHGEESYILPLRPPLELPPQDLHGYPAHDLRYNEQDYRPLFWNVSGPGNGITAGRFTNIHIGDQDVRATAWYVPIGGNGHRPGITIYGFSAGQDEFLDECAIESVVPPELWDGGPTVFTDTSDVTIMPRRYIGMEGWYDWCLIWGTATVTGEEVFEAKNNSGGLLACYQLRDLIPDMRDPFWLKRHFWDLIRGVPWPADPAVLDMPAILKHLERMDYGQLKEIYTGMEAYMAGLKAVDEALLKKMNV